MTISGLSASQIQAQRDIGRTTGAAKSAGAFGDALKQAQNTHTSQEIRKAAAGVTSYALILPVLKQIRQSHLAPKGPFSPGIGENTFGPEFDMQIADRIAQSPNMHVTDAIANRITYSLKARHQLVEDGASGGVDTHG